MKATADPAPKTSLPSRAWLRPPPTLWRICRTSRGLRDALWHGLREIFPDAVMNGADAPRLGNTLNVSIPGYSSETLLMALDLEGVCASSGSACMVGSVVASHVLLAMGLSPERASSAVRFSLGTQTTAEEIEQTPGGARAHQRARPARPAAQPALTT